MLIEKIGTSIRHWHQEKKLFVFSLLFSCILFVVPDNKTFLLVSFLFVVGLYVIFRNFVSALLYAYIFLLPFQNGKGPGFLIVPEYYVYGNIPFIKTVNLTLSSGLSIILLYGYIRDKILSKTKVDAPHVDISDVLLGIFLVANIIASSVSTIPWLSFLLTLQLCQYIFVYYYIQHQHLQRYVAKIMIPIAASLGILEGVWSGLQYLNKSSFGFLNPAPVDSLTHVASEDTSFVRMQGTFSHPNFLGIFMAFIIPIMFYHSISRHTSRFAKIISAIGCVAGLVGLILSSSRASWVFFALGIVILLRISIIKKSLTFIPFVKKLYLTCILFFTITIPMVVIPRISQLAVTFNPTGGFLFRWSLIQQAWTVVLQNPLGVGIDVFPQTVLNIIGEFTSPPTQPHNLAAQVLVSSGFIGLLSFFSFIYFKIKSGLSNKRRESNYPAIVRVVNMIALGIFLSLSMLYPILTEQQIFAWLWVLLSIIV